MRNNLKFFDETFFQKSFSGVESHAVDSGGEAPITIRNPFKGSVADRYAFGDLSKSALCGRSE